MCSNCLSPHGTFSSILRAAILGPAPLTSPETIPEKGWLGITPPYGPIWRTYMVHDTYLLFSLGFLFADNMIVSSFFKELGTSLHELLSVSKALGAAAVMQAVSGC